ncbi:DUF1080 domain-containing protein [Coraliomargarita algicola]|uniref:DUF1080 domain-containing protein n=1 Tax=Coraliomargarita algicola TaxID=3092156 RepID=A0ABZ0RFK7_9BACT|nr:DUF1080 domain-containing protein [Coraliomargarita sp. J2-16]WPJ93969.1 DUF1080 domain-containing protein [Coraliomargarita sp. J2-16]
MKRLTPLLCLLTYSLFAEDGFKTLFDGTSLQGWTAARSSGIGDWGAFSVNENEQAIQTYAGRKAGSKQANDCLVTKTEYSHYILKLEYKWLESRFAPRSDWDRDAGLLFHVHGNLQKVWPLSIEMQIGESLANKPAGKGQAGRFHTGDLFVLGKHLRADTAQNKKRYDASAKRITGKSVETHMGKEKPKGEWNEMEIHVYGSEKASFILNGEVVLETYNMVQLQEDGTTLPLNKGHIGLQAEWAELLYRNILIKEL